MEGKEQFDEFLGGSQKLPNDVHVMKLLSSRASEIAAMTYSIENPQQTKLVFQKLPVYMRRRVMSHNAKRLPRRLREAHLNQMTKSGLPPKTKRLSRRYRRRPRNLLSEYNRRQRNKVWLETHIWHAKRYRMVEKWGYRIASHANDKCFKANYRAVAKHCLMQDISYYTCIEIIGPEEILTETLKNHCNPLDLTFAAKVFIAGTREGTLMFFKKNGYPVSPIGHVHFLWRPNSCKIRTIWIWVHPSFFDDVVTEIVSSFEFEPHNSDCVSIENQFNETCNYVNDKECRMNIHRNTLNRFRFYGPLSLSVLTDTLRLLNFDEKISSIDKCSGAMQAEENKMDCEDGEDSNLSWHTEYYNSQENMESRKVQKQLWQTLKTLQSPSQLPPNIVLGFTVLDPRFHMPGKRTKPKRDTEISEVILVPPTNANSSPIWEQEIRRKVSKACVTTSAINKLRSQCLVPGINNDRYFKEEIIAKIPILLIQKPGVGNTGLCSGIDVILPASWAMPFWLACMFRCVRVGALRESKSIAFEYENTRSPDVNDPDTPAYAREALATKSELNEKYFRYPSNRRANFTKLGISSPFFCEWRLLSKEWTGVENFYVLRDRKLLHLLQENLHTLDSTRASRKKRINLDDHAPVSSIQNSFEDKNCLIRVKVSILRRDCVKRFAIICMPKAEDIEKFESNENWLGPVEQLNSDRNQTVRKNLRQNHATLLKRLKRQRTRCKKSLTNKLSELLEKKFQILKKDNKLKNLLEESRKAVHVHCEKMSHLYLPECTKVRYSCDRDIMGYVTVGDFSFSKAKGAGIGFVTLNSIIELIDKKFPFILVRNIQTRRYSMASLEVLGT